MTARVGPNHEGFLTAAGGVQLFYRQIGAGPNPLVIPNGFHLFEDFKWLAEKRPLIFYDVRNRGQSEAIVDDQKLERGIHNDVDDLEAVRQYFAIEQLDVIGHSYIGFMAGLYAITYPETVNRLLLFGPMQPSANKQYPVQSDNTLSQVSSELAQLQKHRSADPIEACKDFWAVLRKIYVTDAADAHKIKWDRCELPNERNFMKYWTGKILPSIQRLELTPNEFARVKAPVFIIHGTRDRSAPYDGGRDWTLMFPNARLLTVHQAGHAPWVESPDLVFDAIETFLDGQWPAAAERVTP